MIEPDEMDVRTTTVDTELPLRGVRTERRRKRRLRQRAVLALAGIVVVALAAWAAGRGGDEKVAGGTTVGGALEGPQVTYVVTTRLREDISGQADTITLFALDARGRNPFILFVPAAVQAEVPGYGFDSVGSALSFGGVSLHLLTLENMLGADIDHQVTVSDDVIARLVNEAGGIEIDVPERLMTPQGTGRRVPLFEPGRQRMNGDRVRAYLAYLGPDETELSRPARARQVWDALLGAWKDEPSAKLARRFTALGDAWETDAPVSDVARFFAALAQTPPSTRIYSTLPTTPIGAGGDEQALRLDDDGLHGLARQFLGESLRVKQGDPVRVEILNGSGVPQIGTKVSEILVPAGFRLMLDRNADRFDHARTRIIVYTRDDVSLAIARRVRDLLKVGEIEIALQGQTLVDVTVVVGKDFKR